MAQNLGTLVLKFAGNTADLDKAFSSAAAGAKRVQKTVNELLGMGSGSAFGGSSGLGREFDNLAGKLSGISKEARKANQDVSKLLGMPGGKSHVSRIPFSGPRVVPITRIAAPTPKSIGESGEGYWPEAKKPRKVSAIPASIGGIGAFAVAGAAIGVVYAGITSVASGLGRMVDLAGEFGDQLFRAGKYVAVMGSEFESTRVAFESLVGNTKIGRGLFEDLQKFAIETPFTAEKTLGVGKQLLGRGVKPEELMEIMRQIAEVSAGTGTAIELVGKAYADVVGKGKLMAQELNLQLGNAGIGAGTFAEALGVSTAKLTQMMEAGQVTGEMFQKAFKSLADPGGRFAGGMTRQLQTVKGSWSQLVETIEVGAGKLGDAIFTRFPIGKMLKEFSSGFGGMDTAAFIGKIEKAASTIKPLVMNIAKVGLGIAFVGQQFAEKLLPAIGSINSGFTTLASTLVKAGLWVSKQFLHIAEIITMDVLRVIITAGPILRGLGIISNKDLVDATVGTGAAVSNIGGLKEAIRGIDVDAAFGAAGKNVDDFMAKFAGVRGGVDPVRQEQEMMAAARKEAKERNEAFLNAMESTMPGFKAGIEQILKTATDPNSSLSPFAKFDRDMGFLRGALGRPEQFGGVNAIHRGMLGAYQASIGGLDNRAPELTASSLRARSQEAEGAVSSALSQLRGSVSQEKQVEKNIQRLRVMSELEEADRKAVMQALLKWLGNPANNAGGVGFPNGGGF